MTNETNPAAQEPEDDNLEEETHSDTAVATEPEAEGQTDGEAADESKEEEPEKLEQDVEIQDIGPCKKHIKVTIARSSIESCYDNKFSELRKDAIVPGFRKGKAPRKVIERLYHKEVAPEIKRDLLMASLEQLAEEHDIAPLSAPDLDPNKIDLPKEDAMVYEFDVEVRPQFDVPEYKGLKLRRPVKEFTDKDVDKELRKILSEYGQLVPKDGAAEVDDYVIVDMETRFHDKVIGTAKELTLKVDERLAFKDGVAEDFAKEVAGAKAGDSRTVDITMGSSVATPALAGKKVQAVLQVNDVKELRLPELTHDFLHTFGVHSEQELRDEIKDLLERRLEYTQRQSYRQQILQKFEEASQWDLPQDLLLRQARRTLNRRAMEMQDGGMSQKEIEGQLRLMQQDIVRSTAFSLKEHFLLQKIAEEEKIDVNEDEINQEIEEMAEEAEESPRRVRARLEKEQSMDTLVALLIERKALDLILAEAEYEDVPLEKMQDQQVSLSEEQAVEGEMRDPIGEAEEAEKAEKEAEKEAEAEAKEAEAE